MVLEEENFNSIRGILTLTDWDWGGARDCTIPDSLNISYFLQATLLVDLKFSIVILVAKGHLISKCLYGIFNSPNKRTKILTLLLWYLKSNCFCSFFWRIEDTKRHFEIDWPLSKKGFNGTKSLKLSISLSIQQLLLSIWVEVKPSKGQLIS